MEIFPIQTGHLKMKGNFLVVQQLGLGNSTAGAGFNPARETKIMNTAKEREEKHEEN